MQVRIRILGLKDNDLRDRVKSLINANCEIGEDKGVSVYCHYDEKDNLFWLEIRRMGSNALIYNINLKKLKVFKFYGGKLIDTYKMKGVEK